MEDKKYTRILSYDKGKLVAEHIYRTDNQSEAIAAFRKEYPEHCGCVVTASGYVPSENKEHYEVCCRCGVVH